MSVQQEFYIHSCTKLVPFALLTISRDSHIHLMLTCVEHKMDLLLLPVALANEVYLAVLNSDRDWCC